MGIGIQILETESITPDTPRTGMTISKILAECYLVLRDGI